MVPLFQKRLLICLALMFRLEHQGDFGPATWFVFEMVSFWAIFTSGVAMRMSITLDDGLVEKAKAYTGIVRTSALLREALTALVQSEAARRLAGMAGSAPEMVEPSRRWAEVV